MGYERTCQACSTIFFARNRFRKQCAACQPPVKRRVTRNCKCGGELKSETKLRVGGKQTRKQLTHAKYCAGCAKQVRMKSAVSLRYVYNTRVYC